MESCKSCTSAWKLHASGTFHSTTWITLLSQICRNSLSGSDKLAANVPARLKKWQGFLLGTKSDKGMQSE
jgi:hypothetical protein